MPFRVFQFCNLHHRVAPVSRSARESLHLRRVRETCVACTRRTTRCRLRDGGAKSKEVHTEGQLRFVRRGLTLESQHAAIWNKGLRLQPSLICREDQIPGRADAALGTGGYDIPDTAWRRVAIACPDLYLFMAFYRIRDYDNVRRFLTPSIPLRESHLQLGIDLNVTQRQDSDLSCFIRHLGYRYADTLVTLSIQQWRTVEVPLRRILELMPRLTRLFYTGRVNAADVRHALIIVACGVCDKLKQLKIQIQDEGSKQAYWKREAEKLTEEFKDIMELYDINFCIQIYKS